MAPNLGPTSDALSSALFGKTRRAVLALLFGRADESFYLRQIVRTAAVGQGAAQRELKNLSSAGIIRRTVRGRHVYYQADRECPIFAELQGLLVKTAGVAEVLGAALTRLAGRIDVAFIYGSMARLQQRGSSDVDILVVGDVTFGEIVSSLSSAQEKLGREVNPSVYPTAEFQEKLTRGNHFLRTVLIEPKIFVIGDEGELERLAAKRLVDRTQAQSSRDPRSARRSRSRSVR